MVAGRVTIEKVGEKPVGTCLPANAAGVDQPRGEPHPLMIMEPARLVETAHEGIDAGQPRLGGKHVIGHGFQRVRPSPAGGRRLDVVANP